MTPPPTPAIRMPAKAILAAREPGLGTLKNPNADAGIDEQAQLGDGEPHAVPTRETRPSRARLPMPNNKPAVNCTAVTLRLSLTGSRAGERESEPGARMRGRGGNGHLRRYLCPLSRHKVAAPQHSCGNGPEQAAVVRTGTLRTPGSLVQPERAHRRGRPGLIGAWSQHVGRTSVLRTHDHSTPTKTNTSAQKPRRSGARGEAIQFAEEQGAPTRMLVMMFSGVHDSAARAESDDLPKRESGNMLPPRPHQAPDQRQPEFAPAETRWVATGD